MIADLDQTIKQLLVAEMPIKNGEIDVKFDQPTREWSSRLSKPTLNFFLYDLRENNVLRQHQWENMNNGNRQNGDHLSHRKRTPMRLDCRYMLTAWANDSSDEHRLMTRTLMSLYRYPVLPEERLVGMLKNPIFDISASLARHDVLTNPAEVWSALDNELRPSVSYVVTLALDPWTEVTGPAVQQLTFRLGQAANLPQATGLVEGTAEESIYIGGTVSKEGAPQAGVEVAIKGTGLFSVTDAKGRYTLGGFPPGEYTLVAWQAKGKPREKKVSVPSGNCDINL